jgi:hypothetical protein
VNRYSFAHGDPEKAAGGGMRQASREHIAAWKYSKPEGPIDPDRLPGDHVLWETHTTLARLSHRSLQHDDRASCEVRTVKILDHARRKTSARHDAANHERLSDLCVGDAPR